MLVLIKYFSALTKTKPNLPVNNEQVDSILFVFLIQPIFNAIP